MKKISSFAVPILIFSLLAFQFPKWWNNYNLQNKKIENMLLTRLSGEEISFPILGQKTIVVFWATWCPPCVEEMPELDKLYPQLQAQNVELIGIAIDSPSNVDQFLQKTPVNYPIVLAGMTGTELGKVLGNQQGGLPFTIILDENGNELLREAGRIQMSTITNALQR